MKKHLENISDHLSKGILFLVQREVCNNAQWFKLELVKHLSQKIMSQLIVNTLDIEIRNSIKEIGTYEKALRKYFWSSLTP